MVRFSNFLWQNSTIRSTYVNRTLSDRIQAPVASWPEASVCGQSLAGLACSNHTKGRGCLSYEGCVLSGRGLCVELIDRPEESY